MTTWEMAIEELTDAVVFKRAAILAPSQAEAILMVLRRAEAAGVSNLTPLDKPGSGLRVDPVDRIA